MKSFLQAAIDAAIELHRMLLMHPQIFPMFYISRAIRLNLLERVFDRIILPQPDLLSLLRHRVLDERLPRVFLNELSDEPRIPELACNAEIFATPHQGIGFAAFCRGGYAFGREVVHFTTGDGDESASDISFNS